MSAGHRRVPAWPALLIAAVLGGCQSSAAPDVQPVPSTTQTPIGPVPGAAGDDLGPANPFADSQDAIAAGRRYFTQYNCAGCHGDHGGGGMGPSLRDEAWLYGGSHAQVANSIAQGRAYGMPAWGRMLTEPQIWQIAAYIKTMRTDREASPPR